jgi:hypothetical protein
VSTVQTLVDFTTPLRQLTQDIAAAHGAARLQDRDGRPLLRAG